MVWKLKIFWGPLVERRKASNNKKFWVLTKKGQGKVHYFFFSLLDVKDIFDYFYVWIVNFQLYEKKVGYTT